MAEINGIKWHVVPQGQRLTTQLAQSGTGFTDIWEVTYAVDSGPAQGTQGMVKIPASQYNPDTVKSAINEAVTLAHGIAGL